MSVNVGVVRFKITLYKHSLNQLSKNANAMPDSKDPWIDID